MPEKMHYLKAVKDRACPRYGTEAFIGCRRGPKGFVWNLDAVVAITEREYAPHRKAYAMHLRHGDIEKSSKSEYDAWLAKRKAEADARRAEREAEREKQKAEAEAAAEGTNDSGAGAADESAAE